MTSLLARDKYPHDRMVANILRTYRRATPAERAAGATWYSEAREHAAGVGDLVGAGQRAGAAAIAVLSPQTEWNVNVREAYEIACNVADDILPEEHTFAAFPVNVGKAWSILTDPTLSNIDATVSGPKVSAFYRAIAGLPGGPVVDRHATRVATAHEYDGVTRSTYDAVQRAYVDAAARIGADEHALQATTWLVCKRDLAAARGKHGQTTE